MLAPIDDLELDPVNLYSNGRVIVFLEDEEMILSRELLVYVGGPNDIYHVVVEGDTLDGLAEKFYGDTIQNASKAWWVIADANFVYNPLDLSEWLGKEMLIPNILKVKLILSSTDNTE